MKQYTIRLIFLLFWLCFSTAIQAQSISGRVVDEENNGIEFATVVLQTMDSVYVESAYTDESGSFRFNNSIPSFFLLVQHLLYEPFEKEYTTGEVGTIVLQGKDNLLDEVVVEGERPLIEINEGRLAYNMPQLIRNKSVSNAYDALLELPGVREEGEALTLSGAGGVAVILNGKPSTMTYEQLKELLKNTPAAMVEKAEVMYTAPPQYNIRGAAINVIIKRNLLDNLFGQVNAEYSQRYYDNYRGGISLFHSNDKFYNDFLYSISENEVRTGIDINSNHSFAGQVYQINQENLGKSRSQTHQLRLGSEYAISPESNISLAYTMQLTPDFYAMERALGNVSNSITERKKIDPVQMHNVSLYYASTKSGLSGGADYTFYKNYSKQLFEDAGAAGKHFESNSKQEINRLKVYAHKGHQLKKGYNLNYGASFLYAQDKSFQDYITHAGSDMSGQDTDYTENEYTYDAYVSLTKSFSPQFSFSATLMGEYYKVGDYDEWTLFPSLSATYFTNPKHIFQLNFSSDKVYPSYWEMTGSVSYLNSYTEVHGNTDLRPYKSYSAQLTYIFKQKYSLTFFNSYLDDYFVQLPYQSSDRLALIYQTTNFDYLMRTGFALNAPYSYKRFSTRLSMNSFYYRAKHSRFHDISFDKSRWTFYAGLNNSFKLSYKPDISLNVNGQFITGALQGPGELETICRLDADIKWVFANKKAELMLKGNDLFNSWSPAFTLIYQNQNLMMDVLPDARYVSLSLVYKFGGDIKKKERTEVDSSRFGKQ
jgi:hypothetical protein